MLLVSVASGEEVIETVTRELTSKGVRDGAIVSLIGAVEACAVSTMPKADASQDIICDPAITTGTPAPMGANSRVKSRRFDWPLTGRGRWLDGPASGTG